MGRNREYAKMILNVLRKHGPGSFKQITDWVKEDYDREINSYTLSKNLLFLRDHGHIHEEEYAIPRKLKKKKVWALTDKYFTEELRSTLIKAMKEITPIKLLPGTPWVEPMLILGSKMERNMDFISGLLCAAHSRFTFEVKRIIATKFNESERNRIKLLLVKLLWANHKMIMGSLRSEKRARSSNPGIVKYIQELHSIQNASQLLERERTHNAVWRQGFTTAVMHFPRIYNKMIDYKWDILGHVVPELKLQQLNGVKDSSEEIMDSLSQNENEKLLLEFIEEVNQISFVLMVSVGYEPIDKVLWDRVLREFDDWMNSLRKGELDNREWIFSEGLRNLDRIIKKLKKKRRPFPIYYNWKRDVNWKRAPSSEVDKARTWDLAYLYEHHPRGKSLDFYKEIYDAIDERRKQKRLNEANVKETVERVDLDELF